MLVSKDLIFIPRSSVEEFFNGSIQDAYATVKQAYLDFSNKKSKNPPSSFLWYDEVSNSRIIGLPAYLGDKKNPGIKWIASCPHNIQNNIPRASAVIVLNDFDTGFPVAIIEGAVISALRTVLSAILALTHLHPDKNILNLGIIGTGNLAKTFLKCLKSLGWVVLNCDLYDIHPEQSIQFASQIEDNNIRFRIQTTFESLLPANEVILLTTTAVKPYINDLDLFKNNAVVLNLSLRDLAPEIILPSFNIVDDIEHVITANTSPHLAFLTSNNKNFIAGNITQLVLQELQVPNNKLKIFSPMGILDIALANLLFKVNMNIDNPNTIVKDFFN